MIKSRGKLLFYVSKREALQVERGSKRVTRFGRNGGAATTQDTLKSAGEDTKVSVPQVLYVHPLHLYQLHRVTVLLAFDCIKQVTVKLNIHE